MSAEHPPHLAHHFEDLGQQHEAATLGMWIFLGTELMFFGGLFTAYIVFRTSYPDAFAVGSRHLSAEIAGINTLVLLTSSLTMALAVYGAQANHRSYLVGGLWATIALALTFLVFKSYEYYHDYDEGLVPVLNFDHSKFHAPPGVPHEMPATNVTKFPAPPHGDPPAAGGEQGRIQPLAPAENRDEQGNVADPSSAPRTKHQALSADARTFPRRVELFFMLYYIMTGVHALHMIIGIGVMLVLAYYAHRGQYHAEYNFPVETAGLYWHFVDVVWIFLLPLLYLIAGAAPVPH